MGLFLHLMPYFFFICSLILRVGCGKTPIMLSGTSYFDIGKLVQNHLVKELITMNPDIHNQEMVLIDVFMDHGKYI